MNEPAETGGVHVYTVTTLTHSLQATLEERFDFVWVEGEISNFTRPSSGHYYMVLKDEGAQIRAVMFRLQVRYLRFVPENGMKVIARGRIGVYAVRGEYQIILDYLEPLGAGALALAFEQVKKKLAAQGVFDPAIKRPLPFLPKKVAVITSPTGAAIRDFLTVLGRRFANMEILILPVKVQGEQACGEMVRALDRINREVPADVIVLTRGGGSLEDLFAFNQEELALAIRRSNIPVVSAVGHEIDVTISDLASDFRAPTPSAAAELLVQEKEALVNRVRDMNARLLLGIRSLLDRASAQAAMLKGRILDPRKRLAENYLRLDDLHGRLIRLTRLTLVQHRKRLHAELRALLHHSPEKLILSGRQRLDYQKEALIRSMEERLTDWGTIRAGLEKRIMDLGPLSILKRGYSIALKLPEKELIRHSNAVQPGDRLQILLGQGLLTCRVESTNPSSPFPRLHPDTDV